MKTVLTMVALLVALLGLIACDQPIGTYLPVSTISRNGFARDAEQAREMAGEEVRLWGYVDHGNLYGDASARDILGDWWSGEGPDEDSWQFNLKASPNDAVGQSFAVHVPNDAGRDALLRAILADATSGQPTRLFVTGRVYPVDAPANTSRLTGLMMTLDSSDAIRLEPPPGSQRSGSAADTD